MAMSKDRIKFWLGYTYLQNHRIYGVLEQAFSMPRDETELRHRSNSEGFWIICRPSQFARFMFYRNQAGLKNGFLDLKTELFVPKCPGTDLYDQVAEATGVARCDVKTVLLAFSFSRGDLKERYRGRSNEIDVSDRPNGMPMRG